MGLAHYGKFLEAYKVCESARDAVVFANSKDDMFLVHVTWAGKATSHPSPAGHERANTSQHAHYTAETRKPALPWRDISQASTSSTQMHSECSPPLADYVLLRPHGMRPARFRNSCCDRLESWTQPSCPSKAGERKVRARTGLRSRRRTLERS